MPESSGKPRTLYQKILDDHVVLEREDGTLLLYIDRHLIHEVTSPQAFNGLDNRHLPVNRPHLTLATSDHNVPTTPRPRHVKTSDYLKSPAARNQVDTLSTNTLRHRIPYLGLNSKSQGIVHVIGPELGFTLPGTTIVCGDSHTSTHGAFGALAFGIGTSEVEHVLATQTVVGGRWGNMRVEVTGQLAPGVGSKDLMLHIIGTIGTAGGTGMVLEFTGSAIRALSMEARMTLCNMSIEAGARAGLIAPDATTIAYLKSRRLAPKYGSQWNEAVKYWNTLYSDPDAVFDKTVTVDAKNVVPTVTWGTSPEQVVPLTGKVPYPEDFNDPEKQESARQALTYMGLNSGTPIFSIPVDKVFIGSCTNARLSDFRLAARILRGHKISPGLKLALAVPGSGAIKAAAEKEGLDKVFKDAGFLWREAGCSLCVGLNPDALEPGERCASTSNRNFESRQGTGGRTHLVSPAVAAATAIAGTFALPPRSILGAEGEDRDKIQLEYEVGENESEESNGPSDLSGSDSEDDLPPTASSDPSPSASIPTPASKVSPFTTTLTGPTAVLHRSNIDTDAIFPKQFITTVSRTGLSEALFYNLRFRPDGTADTDFPLNQQKFQRSGTKFLLTTGANFGCGSSREHAVWAIRDFGFKVVMAPSFADIFYNNSFKNGLLLIALPSSVIDLVVAETEANGEITINLPNQHIVNHEGIVLAKFEIPERRKLELLRGGDEIDEGLRCLKEIESFENSRRGNGRGWIEESVRCWATERAERRSRGGKCGAGKIIGREQKAGGIEW
ncbi:hypothetical protein GQ43DRAFT_247068 [Delitschia confertaspora ATCC 74209]|uniref:3-isopropylmalate dehydratase n=1 Tax=Delitschia confertaspora ATCC 74209 TaxID=1513339 RepID=A0A9P4JH91_9PLEO|nr:hypothetical protein GQ43DRAFT_247068 [Delitschia confertaspora ATCC 74209]